MNKSINKQWLLLYENTRTIAIPINKIEAIYEKLAAYGDKQTLVVAAGKEYYTCMTMEDVLEKLDAFNN